MSDEDNAFESAEEELDDLDADEKLEDEVDAEEELTPSHYPNDEVMDAASLYLKEIGFAPLLTAEEEVYFARLVQKGDAKARSHMIESNLRLVVKIARR